MSDITENEVLDCSGLSCPVPILKTKKAMKGLSSGQVLKMTSTDPGSSKDVVSFCKRTGHDLMDSVEDGGATHFYIKAK
jgi:tRNA 2-thiouridine synthesizing protein A